MEYSHKFGSNYPNTLIDVGTKKDVDNSVIQLINQYYALIDSNNMDEANLFYKANKTALEPYRIDMAYFNRLEEEIYNTGLEALKKSETIILEKEPVAQSVGCYWIQEY